MQDEEDARAVALQKFAAVRRFAQADAEPCRVLDGLYVGSIGAARNLEALRGCGVTHVVNASPIVPCFHRKRLRYMVLPVFDDPDEDIARFFHESSRYIGKARRKGGVLVHCFAGQSRSVALVLAYLIQEEGLQLGEALALVRKARAGACPNAGFMRQLSALAYACELARDNERGSRSLSSCRPGGVRDIC